METDVTLRAEDDQMLAEGAGGPARFAEAIPVTLAPDRNGTWETLPDGSASGGPAWSRSEPSRYTEAWSPVLVARTLNQPDGRVSRNLLFPGELRFLGKNVSSLM
jgi:hypothetical protein